MDTTAKKPYQKPEIQEIDIKWQSPSLLVTSGDPPPSTGKQIPFN